MFGLAIALAAYVPDAARFDAILDDPLLKGAVVAATVTELDGRVVYERNAGTHMVPASNQKLLSNAFALWALGPDSYATTRFWRTQEGVVVWSDGDPMLTRGHLLDAALRLGVDHAKPVHLWQAYDPGVPPTWEYDDLPNKYAAQVSAFTVDRGSFELWGEGGRAYLLPQPYGVRVVQEPSAGQLRISYDPFKKLVTVRGPVPSKRTRLDTLALPDPAMAAASLLGSSLRRIERAPAREPDVEIPAPTTEAMVRACLASSDNQIAEHLLLRAGGKEGPLDVNNPYPLATQRAEQFLHRVVGTEKEDFRIVDGSGMSRHNYVTARGLARVLSWARLQPTARVWRDALATPGKGTLARRLAGITFAGKTGTLDMVVALSGYVKTTGPEERIVCVILNRFGCSSSEARNLADKFVRTVSETR